MIPYSRQDVSEEDIQAVCRVLRSDFLTQGPVIGDFERAFALRHEVAHAVAVSNATGGLQIACAALGVEPGSRVWTSPNSFIASANCALYCGACIDFVDIDPRTRNMSLTALEKKLVRARAESALPQVVIPVDFAGLPCDLREMRELADRFGFKIVEDASHATGASYHGRPTGSRFADATVFSFHAVKIVTTAEGGMVTTQDGQLAERFLKLRSHGMTRDSRMMERAPEGAWYYEQQILGFNYRMTELHAALGLSQLARLDRMHERRERLAARYDRLLAGMPLLLPARLEDRRSAWHLYVVEIDETRTPRSRAQVFERLRAQGIGANVHYIPIHTQPFYSRLGFKPGDFPASERYYRRAISIPLFPALTDDQQDEVVRALAEALA
ncbi:MAG TPA: UDP-4-amino-4,6-dideoxy-N-acetyl-beta-L-altrosamine transaminase [Steroidobacteraceae bacterium]|jgi:UDP-4-amino-4,6-dideoxy-N-acetyl-beta-L-altrosamine transaminase|nr:UDP-4-amino-4,6-dideoxy-N-acetyl-beta-L-altrosamine transaminase [Steroidobacteraceae bacterium]